MKRAPAFATEADLCAAFIAWAQAQAGKHRFGIQTPVWTPYAETAGWDILLVASDGTQIGIQAKLKFNIKVLQQSVPASWEAWHDVGPDYRAVLVPELDGGHADICAALGLMLIAPTAYGDFSPPLSFDHHNGGWHYWSPKKRCALPEFVPDVIAGASGPVQLTTWKVAALRIVAVLQLRGYVTRQDFREVSVDVRRWTGPGGWLLPGAVPGQFIRGPGLNFDTQHPMVFAQVLEEVRTKLQGRMEIAV